jgi:BirA family biotin operon repressor/biotin-[acetyl-CoA-carboxylase] ligase
MTPPSSESRESSVFIRRQAYRAASVAPVNEFLHALSRVAWVREVVVLDETASTNDEALARAFAGASSGAVVVAERQTAGRGRLGRTWFSEPGSALTASWIVRPAFAVDRWPLIPLIAGVAAADAVRDLAGVDVRLKWPNDLLVDGRKLGGILVEARPPEAVVVGLGVNVRGRLPEELSGVATTIFDAGGSADRAVLLAGIVDRFAVLLDDPDAVLPPYRERCATLGARVRVSRADGDDLDGVAIDVDARGALVVEPSDGGAPVTVSAGDVTHVR